MLYTGVQSNYRGTIKLFSLYVIFLRIIPRTWLPLDAAILHCSDTFILSFIIGVRANIHLGGGRPSFARMDSVGGGGGSSRKFPGSIFCGGGGGSRNFQGSRFCGMPEFFPLAPVTDPKFVLLKLVLCFARIMSTLCPNSCRQTARIGGAAPPAPRPVRLCH